jgi:hypothetical protein
MSDEFTVDARQLPHSPRPLAGPADDFIGARAPRARL